MIGWIIVIIVLVVLLLIPIGIDAYDLSALYNRQDKPLRAGVSEEYRRQFNNIYPDLLDKSIDNEHFIDWILECNPDFDPQEYVPLLEMIVQSREKFIDHQLRMERLIREHRLLVAGWPARWLLRDKSAIYYVPMDTDYSRWGKAI